MKLAILFDNFGHYHLARLRALGAHVDLLAIEVAPKSRDHSWKRLVQNTSYRQLTLLENGNSTGASWQQLYDSLHKALGQFQPEAVAIPGWSSKGAFAAVAVCQNLKIPLVVMSDSNFSDKSRSSWKEALKTRYVANFPAAFVAGAWSHDYLCGLGMPVQRIWPGFDVVDNEFFWKNAEAVHKEPDLRGRLGLPGRYFLTSARFVARKNLLLLLEAFADYRRQTKGGPDSLVILGNGPLESELRNRCTQLGLDSLVHFPGFKQYEELPAYYGLAEAFICPSHWETWGLVVNEAMAAGLPVIVSERCGCVPELIERGRTGLLFDPYDQLQLTECLHQIGTSPETARAMGAAAKQKVGEWGLERFCSGLMAAAQCAVDSGPVSPGILNTAYLRLLAARL